jgi:hypothetical protein
MKEDVRLSKQNNWRQLPILLHIKIYVFSYTRRRKRRRRRRRP